MNFRPAGDSDDEDDYEDDFMFDNDYRDKGQPTVNKNYQSRSFRGTDNDNQVMNCTFCIIAH